MIKSPFILITYGFSQRLFTFEQEGVHKLPIFGEPVLTSLFLKSAKQTMSELLEDKEELQAQICGKIQHAIDMFKIIALTNPGVTVVYNAAPLVEDPQEEIGKVAKQFSSLATVINREYALDDWQEVLESQANSSESESK